MRLFNHVTVRWRDGYGSAGDAPNRHIVVMERSPVPVDAAGAVRYHLRHGEDRGTLYVTLVKRVMVPGEARPRDYTHVVVLEGMGAAPALEPAAVFARAYGADVAGRIDALCARAATVGPGEGQGLVAEVMVREPDLVPLLASPGAADAEARPSAGEPAGIGAASQQAERPTTRVGTERPVSLPVARGHSETAPERSPVVDAPRRAQAAARAPASAPPPGAGPRRLRAVFATAAVVALAASLVGGLGVLIFEGGPVLRVERWLPRPLPLRSPRACVSVFASEVARRVGAGAAERALALPTGEHADRPGGARAGASRVERIDDALRGTPRPRRRGPP